MKIIVEFEHLQLRAELIIASLHQIIFQIKVIKTNNLNI